MLSSRDQSTLNLSEASVSSFGGATFSTGAKRATPIQRAKSLFNNLIDLVQVEWKTIRTMNLGVRSGTGIVDELLLQRIHRIVKELHMLCISQEGAARIVSRMASKLDHGDFQQLQVMLDAAGHEELTDFLRIMRYNTTDPFAEKPIGTVEKLPPSSGRLGGISNRSRASVHLSLPNGRTRSPLRDDHIRFTGLLPEDHALTQTAHRLYRSRLPPEEHRSSGGVVDEAELAAEAEREAQAAALRMYREAYPVDILGPCNLRESLRPPRSKTPPLEYADMEVRWRETTHTIDKDVLLSDLVIKNPSPVWQNPPAYAKLRQSVTSKAATAKPGRISPSPHRPGTPNGGGAGAGGITGTSALARSGSLLRVRASPGGDPGADGSTPTPAAVGKSMLGPSSTPRRDAASAVPPSLSRNTSVSSALPAVGNA